MQTPQLLFFLLIAFAVPPPGSETCERSTGGWWNGCEGCWRRLGTAALLSVSRFLDRQRVQSPVLVLLFSAGFPPSFVAHTEPKARRCMYDQSTSPGQPGAVRFHQCNGKLTT